MYPRFSARLALISSLFLIGCATWLCGGFTATPSPQATPPVQVSTTAEVRQPEKRVTLRNIGYEVEYDPATHLPACVHYHFRWSERQENQHDRPRSFQPDHRISQPLLPDFYTKSGLTDQGYQRGHLAASFAIALYYGREAQLETFLMTNIVPQQGWHNAGIWNTLERIEANDYPRRYGETESWTGPIFGPGHETASAGHFRVPVPTALFKIIRRPDGRCLAFIIPQDGPPIFSKSLPQCLTSVAEIERQTGLTFPISEPARSATATRLW